MYYKLPSGKQIRISDDSISNLMVRLDLTKEEAIQTYLEDEGYLENEEQNTLDEKAKKISINRGADKKSSKKARKKPEIKISDEKKALFNYILASLKENNAISEENIEIVTENKRIEVKINDKSFAIDIIQHRKSKN